MADLQPNEDQQRAIEEIVDFVQAGSASGDRYVLGGYAGTGKTFCMKRVRDELKKSRDNLLFTAPTNKATKVLRESFDAADSAPCQTIYSALGLQLAPNGEVRELVSRDKDPEKMLIAKVSAVVVDEGSMVNSILNHKISEASQKFDVPFIFLGDPAQLNPVGERTSPTWAQGVDFELTKIMRFDNQILNLSKQLREYVKFPVGQLNLKSDNDGKEGIWNVSREQMEKTIQKVAAETDAFQKGRVKAIAWRNVVVDKLNQAARMVMAGRDLTLPFSAGDRIISRQPCLNKSGDTLLHTDDEAEVLSVDVAAHPFHKEFRCYLVEVLTDSMVKVKLWVIHPESVKPLKTKLQDYANAKNWKMYWGLKEAFHEISLAYAITSHRSQGSTYETAFVDYRDILANPDRAESSRCLYVAASRPQKRLFLGS